MKKLSLLILLISNCMFSQEQVNNLPNFSQPSPQAYQMTKYGNVPVNESSGKVNVSIPIYNFKAGNLYLPVGLSYTANGLKVDQMTTWTGVQWGLQAGGVITREIRDLPEDRFPSERRFITTSYLQSLDLSLHSSDSEYFTGLIGDEIASPYDTQTDIFTFSFLNYSGSFYLNENNIPTLTNRSNKLKIEIVGETLSSLASNNEFVITDPTGIKYFFGGVDSIERSFMYNSNLGRTAGLSSVVGTTAYYLTKIVHPLGDEIYLEYQNIGIQEVEMQRSQTINQVSTEQYTSGCVYTGTDVVDPDCGPGYENICSNPKGVPGEIQSPSKPPRTMYESYKNRIQGGKLINKITSNRNNLELLFNTQDNIINANVFKKRLVDFSVIDNEVIVFKADFDYLFPQGTENYDRFFLEKVVLNSQARLNKDKQIYKMFYDRVDKVPKRFSFAQDYIGYYNGSDGNDTYIPKLPSSPFLINPGLANKKPSIDFAKIGSLIKIQYPTGGYTTFEYEADQNPEKDYKTLFLDVETNNQIANEYDISIGGINNRGITNQDLQGFHWFGEYTLPPNVGSFDGENFYVLPPKPLGINESPGVFENQVITVHFGSVPTVDKQKKIMIFQMKDITTGQVFTPESINLCCTERTFQYNLIKGHEYIYSLFLRNSGSLVSGLGGASLEYYDGYKYVDALGVRVKKITDFTKENKPENIKRYYYKKIENINKITDESKVVTFYPYYNYSDTIGQTCQFGLFCQLNYWIRSNQTSVNQRNLTPSNDHSAVYEYVSVSYGGDNFENGGTQMKFDVIRDLEATSFTEPVLAFKRDYHKDNLGVIGGKLLEKIDFINKDGQIYLLKKEENVWASSISEYVPNLYGKKTHEDCYGRRNIANIFSAITNTKSFRLEQTSKTITNYLEPLPLGVSEDFASKLVTKVDYEYGEVSGLPIKITTTNSDGLKHIVKNYYPKQITDTSSLSIQPTLTPIELTAINKLKAEEEHRITSPIQVETYKKDGENPEVLLNAQRNLYQTNSYGFTQVKSVLSSKKGSDFEERIVNIAYDSNGNLKDVRLSSGTITHYDYNELNQVIRKIENYMFSSQWKLEPTENSKGDPYDDLNRTGINIDNYCSKDDRLYPRSQVTHYFYNNVTNLLEKVINPRCNSINYEYDDFHRLKFVRDQDGNILSKNDYNYAPQN